MLALHEERQQAGLHTVSANHEYPNGGSSPADVIVEDTAIMHLKSALDPKYSKC